MKFPTARRLRIGSVAATLTLLVAPVTLAACTLDDPGSETTSPQVKLRDPSSAELSQLKAEILAMKHVTEVELTYDPGSFGVEPSWEGTVTVDTPERQQQLDTLRDVVGLLWRKAELTVGGGYAFSVIDSPGSGVNGDDLGYSGMLHYPDLEELLGPRPTPTS